MFYRYNLSNDEGASIVLCHEKAYFESEFLELIEQAKIIAANDENYYMLLDKQDLINCKVPNSRLLTYIVAKILIDKFKFWKEEDYHINYKLAISMKDDQMTRICDEGLMAIRKKDFRKKKYIQPVLTNVVWEKDED